MNTLSDVFVWRSVFPLATLAALFLGFGAWNVAAWIHKRTRLSSGRKRLVPSLFPRQLRT